MNGATYTIAWPGIMGCFKICFQSCMLASLSGALKYAILKCTSMFDTTVCKKRMQHCLLKIVTYSKECIHSVESSMQTDLPEALEWLGSPGGVE